MLGWRKKRDGFEWHEYVRTTILVRRANRRQKMDDARQAAVDRLKEAGGSAADGLKDAGRAAAAGVHRAAAAGGAAGAAGLARTGSLLNRFAHALGASAHKATTTALAPLLVRLSDRRKRIALGAVGIAALIAAAYRGWVFGADLTTILAAAIAVLALLPTLMAESERADVTVRVAPRGVRAHNSGPTWLSKRLVLPVLAWGAFAVVLILGLGSLLTGRTPDLLPARLIETSSISRAPDTPSRTDSQTATSGDISGRAEALSGDTLRIDRRTLRLGHIASPEPSQTCTRKDGSSWRCGREAASALARLIRGKKITCTITDTGTADRATADCRAGDTDLAAALVRDGHVFADTGFFARHASLESEAREAARGIWAGPAQRPEDFRTAIWEEAKAKAPTGCPIKGEPPSRGKRYVMPWARNYDSMKVRESRGGRWFCSEEEARQAGWQPSGAS